jgi:hypothetical protein
MKIKLNVIHMEGLTSKWLETNCTIVANMTNIKNSCKNVQM